MDVYSGFSSCEPFQACDYDNDEYQSVAPTTTSDRECKTADSLLEAKLALTFKINCDELKGSDQRDFLNGVWTSLTNRGMLAARLESACGSFVAIVSFPASSKLSINVETISKTITKDPVEVEFNGETYASLSASMYSTTTSSSTSTATTSGKAIPSPAGKSKPDTGGGGDDVHGSTSESNGAKKGKASTGNDDKGDNSSDTTIVVVIVVFVILLLVVVGGAAFVVKKRNDATSKETTAQAFENPMYNNYGNSAMMQDPSQHPYMVPTPQATSGYMDVPGQQPATTGYMDVAPGANASHGQDDSDDEDV